MPPRFFSILMGPKYANLPREDKWSYRTVDGEEETSAPGRFSERKSSSSFWSLRNQLQLALALTSGILIGGFAPRIGSGVVNIYNQHYHTGTSINLKGIDVDCGSTPEQAISRGCKFDIVSSTWLPEACHDTELMHQVAAKANWTWYSDPQHTKHVSKDVFEAGKFDVLYPTGGYHATHCIYLIEKFHRAVIKRMPIDEDLYSIEHTKHCAMMLGDLVEPPNYGATRVLAGYSTCRKFEYYDPVDGKVPDVVSGVH